jgi:CRP-like cAMP-binding protein
MEKTLLQPLNNRLLLALPRRDLLRLNPWLKLVSFEQGKLLRNVGEEVEHIYFPQTGMISLLTVLKDGTAIETAVVGREGVVDAMAGLGLYVSRTRAVVQMPMVASRITVKHFRQVAKNSEAIRDLIVRFNEVLLAQVQATAACNALHPLDARLCRWILQSRDRSEHDSIPLTQELLSQMLGVRRTSITRAAKSLQAAGLIDHRHGTIRIVDRAGIERSACECYVTTLRNTAKIIPH